jgi:DNA-binding response OmpR family regulator
METILIVDDEAMARRMLANTLGRAGFNVIQACHGEQAWERLCEGHPDAMLTDIDMPKLNGEQLCRRVTEQIPERQFPIFVITSKTALEHRTWSREMTNVNFVEKPYSMRKLVDLLHEALHTGEGREEAVR